MEYYRIRKEWNGGKWTKDQLGAYTSLEAAKSHITSQNVSDGYKIFSPSGEVAYPILYNKTAEKLHSEGIISDLTYWSDVLDGKVQVSSENLNFLCDKFLKALLSKSEDHYLRDANGCVIGIKFKPENFSIQYIDAKKLKMQSIQADAVFNAGYFGNYKENGQLFTLPGANIVADINVVDIPEVELKYLRERKLTDNGKLHFSAFENVGQFNSCNVSTLVIDIDNKVSMKKLNSVAADEIRYAISGAPFIWDGEEVTNYKAEGWDSSIGRRTTHGVLGLKGNDIYYLRVETQSSNCMTSELYELVSKYSLDYAIKLDGGGSYYSRIGDTEYYTSENRRINNIGIVRL